MALNSLKTGGSCGRSLLHKPKTQKSLWSVQNVPVSVIIKSYRCDETHSRNGSGGAAWLYVLTRQQCGIIKFEWWAKWGQRRAAFTIEQREAVNAAFGMRRPW